MFFREKRRGETEEEYQKALEKSLIQQYIEGIDLLNDAKTIARKRGYKFKHCPGAKDYSGRYALVEISQKELQSGPKE